MIKLLYVVIVLGAFYVAFSGDILAALICTSATYLLAIHDFKCLDKKEHTDEG